MNSKSKGNRFEREISKRLSLWFSNGESDDLFWRTASSGGRFTQRFKKGKNTVNQAGDITNTCADSEEFSKYFLIECKSYKDIKLWTLLTGIEVKDSVLEWWNLTKKKSSELNKIPVLITRQNRKPDLLITNNHMPQLISPNAVFKSDIFVYKLDDFLTIKCHDIINELVIPTV